MVMDGLGDDHVAVFKRGSYFRIDVDELKNSVVSLIDSNLSLFLKTRETREQELHTSNVDCLDIIRNLGQAVLRRPDMKNHGVTRPFRSTIPA